MTSLQQIIERAAAILPCEGLVPEFVHRNPLRAWEHLPFSEAAREAATRFGGEPYLSEQQYRRVLQAGRIRETELEAVLSDDLAESGHEQLCGKTTRLDARLAMLLMPIHSAEHGDLPWVMAETEALAGFHNESSITTRTTMIEEVRSLLAASRSDGTSPESRQLRRAVDNLRGHFHTDGCDGWDENTWESFTLHWLWYICREGIRLVGQATARPHQPVRHRDLLFDATRHDTDLSVNRILIDFCSAFLDQGVARFELPARNEGFFRAFISLYRNSSAPHSSLHGLGHELSKLQDADVEPLDSIQQSLDLLGVAARETEEYIAASLWALPGWAGRLWYAETNQDRVMRPAPTGSLVEFLATRLLLDRLAVGRAGQQYLAFNGPLRELRRRCSAKIQLSEGGEVDRKAFVAFQLAQVFGWRLRDLQNLPRWQWATLAWELEHFRGLERRRIYQLAFERSYQRQLLDRLAARQPDVTRSTQCRFQAIFCSNQREESVRRRLERIAPDVETFGAAGHFGIAMYYRGLRDTRFRPHCPASLRPTQCVREIRRVKGKQPHPPGLLSRIARSLQSSMHTLGTSPATDLQLECPKRKTEAFPGYRPEEMVSVCAEFLQEIGLVRQFSRLILLVAHSADELARHHAARFDCGICGSADGANARVLAKMMNDACVREALGDRGITIPNDTFFIACFHDTSTRIIRFLGIDDLPDVHREELCQIERALDWACLKNGRDDDPETSGQRKLGYGHPGNAVCFAGRRCRTSELSLDGRAFLVSYDPTQDEEGSTLARLVNSTIASCIDVNLQYYFSHVDPRIWGCGNVFPWQSSSLLGVVDAATGDMRSGLPWPLVCAHEPLRLLVVVECPSDRLLKVMADNKRFSDLCRNGWLQLVALSPDSRDLAVLRDTEFVRHNCPPRNRLSTVVEIDAN